MQPTVEDVGRLRECWLFSSLDGASFEEGVLPYIDEVLFSIGDYVFNEGDPGDALYVIKEGMIKVTKSVPDDEARIVAQLGEGEVIGEMALVSGDPRSTNCVFISNGRLYRIDKPAWDAIKKAAPGVYASILYSIAHLVSSRLSTMTHATSSLLERMERTKGQVEDLQGEVARGETGVLDFFKKLRER